MLDIINTLLELKTTLGVHDGEILSMTLNKAGKDAIRAEVLKLTSRTPIHVCSACGRATGEEILGIKII